MTSLVRSTHVAGTLSVAEVTKASRALGFEAVTGELLRACGVAEDGTVRQVEFMNALQLRTQGGARAKTFANFAMDIAKNPTGVLTAKERLRGKMRKTISASRLFPKERLIDPQTNMLMTAALSKIKDIDDAVVADPFYDPSSSPLARERRKHLDRACGLLRSSLRELGFRALELFQSWDKDETLDLTRHEMQRGLTDLGLSLSLDAVTHLFDHIALGYHLQYDHFKYWVDDDEVTRQKRAAAVLCAWARGYLARKGKRYPSRKS
jgi:hypothetical protein